MAVELAAIVDRLAAFHDFAGKTVIAVGAGGGRLIDYARPARRVLAVDRDPIALQRLAAQVHERGLDARFALLERDFSAVEERGDVVLFEFCLHEIADPRAALDHAQRLAPDVVVIDHAPGSAWSWYAAEDEAVAAAWRAVEDAGCRRREAGEATQRFGDFAELAAKLNGQGSASLARAAALRDETAIAIPMPYWIALL